MLAPVRLREYLQAIGENQTDFAARASQFGVDVSQTTVSRIVLGGGCNAGTALAIIRASHERPTPGGGTISLEDLALEDAA